MNVNMTGELNMLIFGSIVLVFHLTNCQPNNLNLTWTTLDKHCRNGNGSLVILNNSTDFGSPTEFLIRPMWPSADGNYTLWVAYLGCFDIDIIPHGWIKHDKNIILSNTLEGCYLECQKENISCGQNESVYFALKKSICFCVCKIQEFLSRSSKCNESCYSNGECKTDNYITVYTKYAMENKRSDGVCLVCSKVDINADASISAFSCYGEHFGLCVEGEENCFGIKEDHRNNYSTIDCTQQLPFVCLKNNDMITNNQTSEVTSTTEDQSSEDITPSVVHSSEDTSTITVQSSKPSSKYPVEVPSSIPLNSSTSFDKATMSSTDTVGAIVGLFVAIFALTTLVILLWFYSRKRKHKLRDSQINLHQIQSFQTVNNTYTDVMLVSGTNRTQNNVVFTTTTNDVRIDDIYVENEEGEYDHLHSSRPKQVVSEREDERYATSSQLEDVSYSTVRNIRKSVSDCDNEYDSMSASLDNSCRSVPNPHYEFCYQSSQRKDC